MRIAYVCADRGIPYGGTKGASVHMFEITRALAAEGSDVLVLSARPAPAGSRPPPPGVHVEPLPDDLERRLAAFGAELVVERLALHAVEGSAAARRLGLPHLVELNSPVCDEAVTYRTLDRPEEAAAAEAAVLAAATLVLAVSRPLADHARSKGAPRVDVVPNAAALDHFPPRLPPPGPVRAVLAGTLRPWHGVSTVARAWELLGPGAPELLVVGDGPGREALEAVGATVTGPVPYEEVPNLLATAHIGLAPYEAGAPGYFSPLKLFDYLAAGLAVVAGDLVGVTDVVDDRSAVVTAPGDAAALAAAVAGLAADDQRRARLGRAGRALVASRHTWAHRARQILAAAAAAGTAPDGVTA